MSRPPGIALLGLTLGLAAPVLAAARQTMYVDGRFLRDRCGEKVVLRGANTMIIYWDRTGEATYPELAKTGANACRIFWTVKAQAPPRDLDRTLANCRAQTMIPIPCVWDAGGKKWDHLGQCVDFWCRPDIVAVLRKHAACLIVNIANEAGTREVTNEEYRKAYAQALVRMREAGLHMPLMIDAAHWGRGESYILENARYLVEQDPDHNVLFSWHPWDTRQPQSRYQKAIDASIEQDICLVVGEFSRVGVFYKRPIDWKFIIRTCQEEEIGWLAWVWWCGKKNSHDGHSITRDKVFGHWANAPWGEAIAVSSPYSIAKTSQRTYYLQHGTCKSAALDTTPPKAPSGLKAGPARGAHIELTWTDNSDDEANFDIQARAKGKPAWRTVRIVAKDTRKASIGGLHGLRCETAYQLRVGAHKGHGVAAWPQPVAPRTGPSLAAGGQGTGLTGEYFNKPEGKKQKFLDQPPVLTRPDPQIDFDWKRGSPDPKVNADHFMARWTGQIEPPETADYTFFTHSDDFAWLWVDGRKVIEVYGPFVKGWGKGTIRLEAGRKYDLRLEYREWGHAAEIHLYWATLALEKQIVPTGRLYPAQR
ncbi:MAG: PA14 domain-containing protein [Planctomycetota bacterium]